MLELRAITLALHGRPLISHFDLVIGAGEIVTLMGASGSGKSSLLSFIGGDLPESFSATGAVLLNGQNLAGVAAEQRGIGRLFQDDLLFPHMTVAENLAFAVRDKKNREDFVRAALLRADLEDYGDRAPHTLSGGQRARVALMRTLLAKPAAILLDEPFNRLDEDMRQTMRDYTYSHIRERAIPALLVTHDRADAPHGSRILKIGSDGDIHDA